MKKFVNILTLSRLLATLFLPIIWHYLKPLYIVIFVALVLLTDAIDGFLARKFHVMSLFGSLLDSIADKIFGIALLIVAANVDSLFYILVIQEVLIASLTIIAATLGATTKSTWLGKIKTWILGIAIVLCLGTYFDMGRYIFIFSIPYLSDASLFIACGSEVIVFADYLRNFFLEIKDKHAKIKYELKKDKDLFKALFDTEYYLKNRDKPLYKLLLK